MIWAVIGILIGIIAGLTLNLEIPIQFTKYSAVAIIGILDSLFGAIRAEVTKDQFDTTIFLTGLVFNIVLALGITLLGEQLGLDLYLAATVVFTFRIFSNVGITRRALIQSWLDKKKQSNASTSSLN